jgi:uncharacterized protein with NRDE domain
VCTLTLAWQVFADEPVVVAANRDEALERPSEPPARRTFDAGGVDPSAVGGRPAAAGADRGTGDAVTDETAPGIGTAVVAPADGEAGGTWVGYNEHGLFVGVTNRWVPRGSLAAERSRGLLVRDALARRDAETATRYVERAVEAHEYDGFNLVVADATGAFLIEWDGSLRVTGLDPGVHVVVNVGAALGGGGVPADQFFLPEERPEAGERQADNARGVRAALVPEPGETAGPWVERAKAVLSDHEYGVCVHGDDEDPAAPPAWFGTRSSSVIRIADDRRSYAFADGPPCRTDFAPVSDVV